MNSQSQYPPSPAGGRSIGFVLGLTVFVCVMLIGASGYIKFQLDHVQNQLLRMGGADYAEKLAAQELAQFWSMVLTLLCWGSLIIACALVVGIYLTLRGRHGAPLRALSQSVRNMARGDLRTPIWGMERTDNVGDLSRAVDLARYHFSQLPDMSLVSDQGPVRMRFEGNTRSLFEAMMQLISRDSEKIRTQAETLSGTITKQQEALDLISSRVEAVLHNVEKRGIDGDQQIRQVMQNVLTSANGLKNAQEHAADQLNRILPYLQERAQGMAEITQITGKQVAQILASLTLSERGLRVSAQQSEEAIRKLSTSADTLGERMFGAVNLLQAGGKVLAETTEKTQSRLNETIDLITAKGMELSIPPEIATRLDVLAELMESARRKIDQLSAVSPSSSVPVVVDLTPQLASLTAAVEATQRKMDEAPRVAESFIAPTVPDYSQQIAALLLEIKTGFDTTAQHIKQMQSNVVQPVGAVPTMPAELGEQMRDHWYQMAAQIEATRGALEQTIIQQISAVESRLGTSMPTVDPQAFALSQRQMEQQTQILSELVATLGVLDTHMQQLKSEIGESRSVAR